MEAATTAAPAVSDEVQDDARTCAWCDWADPAPIAFGVRWRHPVPDPMDRCSRCGCARAELIHHATANGHPFESAGGAAVGTECWAGPDPAHLHVSWACSAHLVRERAELSELGFLEVEVVPVAGPTGSVDR